MEFIMIGESKIKVMLEKKDMEYYDITSTDIDYENATTRRAFRKILQDVRESTGFDVSAEQVLVQIYPSKDGGCEMFVTKLSQKKSEAEKHTSHPKEMTMLSIRHAGYLFSSFEDLLLCAKEAKNRGFHLSSSLYRTAYGKWLLLIEEKTSSSPKRSIGRLSFLEEFAEKKKGSPTLAYITEHSQPVIAHRAVETLATRLP